MSDSRPVRVGHHSPDKPGVQRPAASEGLLQPVRPKEIGGQKGPEPTRYGDWEKNGRCTDF